MTHRFWLVAVSMIFTVSCKSRYGFTDQKKEGAVARNEDATPAGVPIPTTKPTSSTTSTPSVTTTTVTPAVEPAPQLPGGPVAGIEVWQDGKLVNSIQTGTPVQFKPTPWTRDTSATSGCEINRGIVQASWTIGSRAAADLQRYAGQDCRLFDYSGTFTKPGQVVVQLDVVSSEGEQAHAELTVPVTGDAVSTPVAPTPVGTTPTPTGVPAQQ